MRDGVVTEDFSLACRLINRRTFAVRVRVRVNRRTFAVRVSVRVNRRTCADYSSMRILF